MGSFPTLLTADLTSSTGANGWSWPAAVALGILSWVGATVVFVLIWNRFQRMVERKRVLSSATVSVLRDGSLSGYEASDGRVRRRLTTEERGGAASQIALYILAAFGGLIALVVVLAYAFGEPVADEPEARPADTTIVTGAGEVTIPPPTSSPPAPVTPPTTEAAPEVFLASDDVEFISAYEDFAVYPDPTLARCLSSQAQADLCADLAFATWDLVMFLEAEARQAGWTCVETATALLSSSLLLTEGPDGMTDDDAVSFLMAGITTWAPDGLLWDSIDCMDEAAALVGDALTEGVNA